MIKRIYSIITLSLLALFLGSCSITNVSQMRSGSTMPDLVWLKMTLDDYEYLGETEIEVQYNVYFGSFRSILSINGEAFSRRNQSFTVLNGNTPINLSPNILNRAVGKAYKAYPEADFLMPVMTTKEIQQLFLGKKITVKAKIKSYKIRK